MGKVILVTLLIVFLARCFLIESFSVSSPQMESAISQNDKVLIDKTAYGIRLPVTVLSIPFTFDNIGGFKSYSSSLKLPYKRIFERKAGLNDIVLFNNPIETDKPLDKRSLILSRIVGLPGDSMEVREGMTMINGQRYTASPDMIESYKIKIPHNYDLDNIIEQHHIRIGEQAEEQDTLVLSLNKYDAFLLKEFLPDTVSLIPVKNDTIQTYKFTIPAKDKSIAITEDNFSYYKQIISWENNNSDVIFDNGMLIIDGIRQGIYSFKDDYYWVLSDNVDKSLDSRHLGFIPFSSIIGKARFIWYSKEKSHCFSKVE